MASGGGVLGANATRREERSATAQSGEGCVDVLRPPPAATRRTTWRSTAQPPPQLDPGGASGQEDELKRTSAVELPGEPAPQAIKKEKIEAGDRRELRALSQFAASRCDRRLLVSEMLSFSAASLAFSGVNPLTERITPVSRSAVTMAESGTYKLHMHRAPAIVPRASR